MNYENKNIQNSLRNLLGSGNNSNEANALVSRNMRNGALTAEQFMIGNFVQVMKKNAEVSNENTNEIVDAIDNIYRQPIAKSEFSELKMILSDIRNNAVTFYNKILEGKLENQDEKYNVIPAEYETLDVKKEEKEEDIKKEEEKKSILFMDIADVLDDIKTKLYEKKEKEFDIPLKKIIGFFKPMLGGVAKLGFTTLGILKFEEGIENSQKIMGRKLDVANLDDMPSIIKVGFANFLSSLTGHLVKPETIYNFFSTVQDRMMDFIQTMTGIKDFGKLFNNIGDSISESIRPILKEWIGEDSWFTQKFDELIEIVKSPLDFFKTIWQNLYITVATLSRYLGQGLTDRKSFDEIMTQVTKEVLKLGNERESDLNDRIEEANARKKELEEERKLYRDENKIIDNIKMLLSQGYQGNEEVTFDKFLKDLEWNASVDNLGKAKIFGNELTGITGLSDYQDVLNYMKLIKEQRPTDLIEGKGISNIFGEIIKYRNTSNYENFTSNLEKEILQKENEIKKLNAELLSLNSDKKIKYSQTDKTLNATNMNKQAELKSEAEKKTTTPVIVNENNTVNNNVISNGNDLTTSMGNTQTDYAVRESMR